MCHWMHFLDLQPLYVFMTAGLTTDIYTWRMHSNNSFFGDDDVIMR